MNAPSSMHEMKVMTQLPEMGTGPLPVEPYISPAYFQNEKEKIFKRAWINVGRVSAHLSNPGDYMVRELDFLNAPILLVHGRDGVVRGFYNVCTHRGNSVASGSGNARSAFVCGFHGWAFGLDGALKTVPSEEQFPGLDRSQYGLKPIATAVWRGFVFINAQEQPDTSLVDFLGGWGKQMEGVPFEDFDHIGRYATQLKCNWKVYIDAFQEAYHVGIVHAETFSDLATNPETFVLNSFRTYGPHRSLSLWANPQHKPSPAEGLALVAQLRAAGVRLSIFSGDASATVQHVGDTLGIADARGGMTPEGKYAALKILQAEGAVVAMVGDGVNDAPVLAQAQVSIVLGGGADLARAQADIVLLGNELSALPAGLHLARRSLRIVRQNLVWAAAYNLLAIPLAMTGWITPWMAGIGMSASSLLVVLNALRLQRA